jgi:hypothetical protein
MKVPYLLNLILLLSLTLLQSSPIYAAQYHPQIVPEFFTGINVLNFQQCEKRATTNCGFATTDDEFKACLNRIPLLPQCKQFNAFAKLADFGAGSHVDAFNTYNDVNIFLIHVVKLGTNYPGDFYFITRAGELIKVTDDNIVDITKSPDYQAIADHYHAVELEPVIREMPIVMRLQNSNFLFTFKFPLHDGCATCAFAGYANVGFEFAYNGKFRDVKILNMTNPAAKT